MIREAVSSGPIRNSWYAILMAGEALPHKTQQMSAVRNSTGNRVQALSFFLCNLPVIRVSDLPGIFYPYDFDPDGKPFPAGPDHTTFYPAEKAER
jgi:hypothetical protein